MSKLDESATWRKGMDLVKAVYIATSKLPSDEKFGLVSQMRRSAVSVPSNFAEGFGRHGDGEFLHFVGVSRGSLFELETQIKLCKELNLIRDTDHLLGLCDECGRLLMATQQTLRRKRSK